MSVLESLKRQRRLYVACPNCDEKFPLSRAGLFDATKPLTDDAREHLEALRRDLKQRRLEFDSRKLKVVQRSQVGAEAVNIGKTVEKIAPSLPGFPLVPGDCRSLLEPIDYVVFRGLSTKGAVDAIDFVDVKSGRARLSKDQLAVRNLVESGRVSVEVTDTAQ